VEPGLLLVFYLIRERRDTVLLLDIIWVGA
jgi:hypothetical protein